ncbi:MAG: hypothetical protein A2451_01905 [Bdellovibrionales bacterium RIFOXYC2_FULL_39_8]|nr:MAG: hypothetical protein A2451_01905 [Bdellovibrionales bacterium RIFOXYC2_FULL_39_8]
MILTDVVIDMKMVDNRPIDIFALAFKIKEGKQYFKHFAEPFYHWPLHFGKKTIRLDIVILYDRTKLKRIVHKYDGRDDIKKDGFVFKEKNNKVGAIRGIIQIM